MYNLKDKVALVTGAGHKLGLGRAIAVRLAKEGADVVVTDLHFTLRHLYEEERCEGWRGVYSTLEEIEALGCRGLTITADLTNVKEVDAIVEKALAKFGKIDILVNNAGIPGKRVPIMELDERDWKLPLEVNLTTAFRCSKAVAKGMIERGKGGKIINISSLEGKMALGSERAAYISSKFGLLGFTQALALELAPHKINVNAVCPGAVDTGIINNVIAKEAKNKGISAEEAKARYYGRYTSIIPLGRLGTAEDIANVVAFLASSESDYITGQAVNVNGGWLMAH